MQDTIIKTLRRFRKEKADYTNLIFFFAAFIVFIVFIIRPSLNEAFARAKRLSDLQTLEGQYEQSIAQIINYQTQMQDVNSNLFLLDEAMPRQPNINKLLADIRSAAASNNIILNRTDVGQINLVREAQARTETNAISVAIEAQASYANFQAFQKELYQQRRLKKITTLTITKAGGAIASQSSGLKIQMEIEGYYL